MDSPLAAVFLGIIAFTGLLQAAFVGALAFAARLGTRKLDALEEAFDATVAPQVRRAAKLTDKAAALSEKSLAQARNVDALVEEASRRVERRVDRAASRLETTVERAAVRLDTQMAVRAQRVREHRLLKKLSGAAAFARGVQRAVAVWQASAAQAAGDGNAEDADEAEDVDLGPGGGPPSDPSPA